LIGLSVTDYSALLIRAEASSPPGEAAPGEAAPGEAARSAFPF
jgi:hypothetical protein